MTTHFGPFFSVQFCRTGERIELAPHLDRWMMGDRLGQVVAFVRRINTKKGKRWQRCAEEYGEAVRVRLDVSGKLVTLKADGIGKIFR
jgi:hypothetical protein